MAKKNADMTKINFEKLQNEFEAEKNVNNSLRTQAILKKIITLEFQLVTFFFQL